MAHIKAIPTHTIKQAGTKTIFRAEIADLEQAKLRIQTVLREVNKASLTTQTSAINNRDQLKMGVAQVASGALAALKERDYGQFACCIHLLCKVALAVYRQTDRPFLQQMRDVAHAALDLLSLLMEAEEELLRLGSTDPVAAITQRAHVKLAAQLTDRLELHMTRWTLLINDNVTLASTSSSSSSSSPSQPAPTQRRPTLAPLPLASDSGGEVHYHIACYLGLEAILRERQQLYDYVERNPEDVREDVRASVRRIIAVTKGLVDVIRVNREVHQATLRRLKGEVVSKLKTFTETATSFVREHESVEELEHARGQVLPELDCLLHELHDARDFMLDADTSEEVEPPAATGSPLVRRLSIDTPKARLSVETHRRSLSGDTMPALEGPGLLTDHVRRLTAYLTLTVANLLAPENDKVLADGPHALRSRLSSAGQCAIQLGHRHRPHKIGSCIDSTMKHIITHVEQLIADGFDLSDVLARVLSRKQQAIYRESAATSPERVLVTVPVEVVYNKAELAEIEEDMLRAAKNVKARLNALLSHLKTLKEEEQVAAAPPVTPPAALPPTPPADAAVIADVRIAVKEIVQATQPMLELCKAELEGSEHELGRDEREQAAIRQHSARLAELLSRLLAHVPDAEEKRRVLRQAVEMGDVVKRFRADKTRGELNHYLVEEHRYQLVVFSVHQFLGSIKRNYALLRDGRP